MSDASFLAEYDRVIAQGGVVQLADWSTLVITGADRVTFLQNMCTNDVRALPEGESREAFLTDVKGKIVGHVIVIAQDDALMLVGVPGQAAKWIAHLDRYIIREDVQLRDASEQLDWSIAVGSGVVAEAREWGRVIGPCSQVWTGGVWVAVEKGGADLATPRQAGVSAEIWHALRIESGWPLYGVDFDGSHLPQEVSRNDQAISFRKGCYLGQETVARIDALGHVNKQLATVEAAAEMHAGDELAASGQVVGQVTSVSYAPRRKSWLAIAMLRRGHNEPGASLACRELDVTVVPAPAVVA